MSCEFESIVEQTDMTEESPGWETSSQSYRQLATPPASPIASIRALLISDQKEMPRSIADLSMP